MRALLFLLALVEPAGCGMVSDGGTRTVLSDRTRQA